MSTPPERRPGPAVDAVTTATVDALRRGEPVWWNNPARAAAAGAGDAAAAAAARSPALDRHREDMAAAEARFVRLRPLLRALFPELGASGGEVESPLVDTPRLQAALGLAPAHGRVLVKADHLLPVAGSVKARGGLHEVLEFAETLARAHGLPVEGDALASPAARALFGRHRVAVGSTGNLGLSIGIAAAALGFEAVVHMSAEAKAWKKARLRARGVTVVEHEGDYAQAVAAGRAEAALDPRCHFVDDENSRSLFAGYAAAAAPLAAQFARQGVVVDAAHPLFVYLPCGVGGAPGGIAFGLAQRLGPHVHAFFAEPVQSPCVLVRLLAPDDAGEAAPSVYDFGLTNRTEADGLAVPRASDLAVAAVRPTLSGVFTVADDTLFRDLYLAESTEGLRIEPSAAAGFGGPVRLVDDEAGRRYLRRHALDGGDRMTGATHLLWTTGGAFVPAEEYARFHARGERLVRG